DASLKDLSAKLKPLVQERSPFKEKIRTNMPVTWVKPVLVANIKFTELTTEKIFRHPVFQGLRVDKKATEVKADPVPVALPAKKKASKQKKKADPDDEDTGTRIMRFNGNELKLTNQNKVYWPEEGYTKGDMISYYNTMYKYILPYLEDRPESLNRTPNGI